MGDQDIHAEAVEPQSVVSSYTVLLYRAAALPDEYRALIYSAWKKSHRHGNDFMKLIVPAAYYEAYDKVINNVMGQDDAVVRLAVLSDEPDVVLGFSVSRGTILEYVYVFKDHRRLGIGRKLLPSKVETITHLTKTGMSIWGSKFGSWKFNPFA